MYSSLQIAFIVPIIYIFLPQYMKAKRYSAPRLQANALRAFFWLWIFAPLTLWAQTQTNNYQYHINLTKVEDDKLFVELVTPKFEQDKVVFRIPRIVPGTYDISDFGRFLNQFKAEDANGKELDWDKIDVNSYSIKNAKSLYKITYWMDDTWDTEIKDDFIFEPGGTNIEAGKNFVINPFGFFGYFDGFKRNPFEVTFTKPRGFYGSTALVATEMDENREKFVVPSYMELADSPIMFNAPDTTSLMMGGAQVMVSVYSPEGMVKSGYIAKTITQILEAEKAYLGGKLPIKKYCFIFYMGAFMSGSGSHGALEHSLSSFYYLPEMPQEDLESEFRDIAAHEFFHIVTPLNIHSEEIHDFDYNDPKMSQHLWFYEGVTEYVSHHCQVMADITDLDTYLKVLREKMITAASQYKDDVPFTELSKFCLDKHKDQYGNVYQKGALIGMCLDIQLREYSEGKYGLQDLIADLSKKYGPERAFKDDEFFDVITQMTYPQIGEFFKKHVAGPEPLPFEAIFKMAGIRYRNKVTEKRFSLGGFDVGANTETKRIKVAGTDNMDAFGRMMKYKTGDEILLFNQKELTFANIEDVLGNWFRSVKEGDVLEITVLRPTGKKQKEKKVKLKAKVTKVDVPLEHNLSAMDEITERQRTVLRTWLGKN